MNDIDIRKLFVADETFKYSIRVNKRSKYIRITIDEEKKIKITIPLFIPIKAAEDFLREKIPWVKKKFIEIENKRQRADEFKAEIWKKVFYLGKEYTIDLVELQTTRPNFYIGKHSLIFHVNPGDREWVRNEMIRALMFAAQKEIFLRTEKHAKRMNLKFNNIKIKNQKTLWGSCSSKNNLNFNWRLVMCPVAVLEYIIIHELAHIKHPNHSRRFWNLVEEYSPDFNSHRRWLREHQHMLKI